MAQFLTDKYVKYRAALLGVPIEGDLACESCGYNLRGLRFSGRCPECGVPIRYRRDPDIPLHDMPLRVIQNFRASAWLASLSLGGLIVLLAGGARLIGSPSAAILLLVTTLVWILAVWRLTPALDLPQAVKRGFGRSSRLRLAARWLQLAWVAHASPGAAAAWAGAGPPSTGLIIVGAVTWVAGMGGVLFLAVLLGRLADWARDAFAEKAFTTCIMSAALAIPVLIIIPLMALLAGPLALAFLAVALALMVISLLTFPVGLFALARTVDWSLAHARDRVDRSRELADRVVTRDAGAAPVPAGDDPIPLSGGGDDEAAP